MQPVMPVALAMVPRGHVVQLDNADTLANWPNGHAVQSAEPLRPGPRVDR